MGLQKKTNCQGLEHEGQPWRTAWTLRDSREGQSSWPPSGSTSTQPHWPKRQGGHPPRCCPIQDRASDPAVPCTGSTPLPKKGLLWKAQVFRTMHGSNKIGPGQPSYDVYTLASEVRRGPMISLSYLIKEYLRPFCTSLLAIISQYVDEGRKEGRKRGKEKGRKECFPKESSNSNDPRTKDKSAILQSRP